MLDHKRAAHIFNQLSKHSSADELEVIFNGANYALTRFANNTIHQNVADENHVLSVRTAFDGRTARATTNKFDEESLKRVVRAAESLAKVQHPDVDLLPVPASAGDGAGPAPSRYFDQTAAVTPEQRADSVRKIVAV